MLNLSYIIPLILLNLILVWKLSQISQYINLYDFPDFKRKIHKQKISCIGGFYIFLNLIYLLIFDFFHKDHLVAFEYFQYENVYVFFFSIAFFLSPFSLFIKNRSLVQLVNIVHLRV